MKTRFLRELRLYLQNGKVNYYDFLAQNTFDHKQKNEKKFFSKFFFIFDKKSTLKKIEISQKPVFFHEIQNFSSLRPIFLGPQSSASISDLFGQGEQFSEIFFAFLGF